MTNNPFFQKPPPRTTAPPRQEARPVGDKDIPVKRIVLTCMDCGEPCGYSYRGELVHDDDYMAIKNGQIVSDFSDHTPRVEIIDTTARES